MTGHSGMDDWIRQQAEERRRFSLERALQFIHTSAGKAEDMEGIALRIENYIQFGSFDGGANKDLDTTPEYLAWRKDRGL